MPALPSSSSEGAAGTPLPAAVTGDAPRPTGAAGRAGFHHGELLVQRRAGAAEAAARLAGMLAAPEPGASMRTFIAERDLIFLTARDERGTLWTSALAGRPGFCSVHDTTLQIRAAVDVADLLGGLVPGNLIGSLLVDFATRRRLRINGAVTGVHRDGLTVAIDQAYGNCPRYIHRRELHADEQRPGSDTRTQQHAARLTAEQIAQIRRADTFLLGTAHPSHGIDTSHRGGAPGFVRVEPDGSLWWPDYPGNNLFNSLGNIAVDPEASLLLLEPSDGRVLQIAGRAVLEWVPPDSEGDDGSTGRRVHLWPSHVITTDGLPWQSLDLGASRDNPPLT